MSNSCGPQSRGHSTSVAPSQAAPRETNRPRQGNPGASPYQEVGVRVPVSVVDPPSVMSEKLSKRS
jgi:hypothetical protein